MGVSLPVMAEPADELELFERARRGDRRARNEVVEHYMGFAAHIARRFSAAHSAEDIRQAAMVGLIKAVDRFDPIRGHRFTAFAGVTIEGELKRHLRDHSWTVRVPRSAKELHALVRSAGETLPQVLGRSPTVDEVARHLSLTREDVLRGQAASAALEVRSIDAPGPSGRVPAATIAAPGSQVADFLNDELVRHLLARLPARERRLVELRFYERKSQTEIAQEMGISQMHVSRLLRSSLELMRRLASDAERP